MRLRLHVTSYNGGSDKNCMCGDWFFYILYNFTYWIQTAWRKLKSDQNWSPYLTGAAAVFQVHQRSLRKFSEDKMQEWWEVGYTAQYLIRLLVSFRRGQPTNLQKKRRGSEGSGCRRSACNLATYACGSLSLAPMSVKVVRISFTNTDAHEQKLRTFPCAKEERVNAVFSEACLPFLTGGKSCHPLKRSTHHLTECGDGWSHKAILRADYPMSSVGFYPFPRFLRSGATQSWSPSVQDSQMCCPLTNLGHAIGAEKMKILKHSTSDDVFCFVWCRFWHLDSF